MVLRVQPLGIHIQACGYGEGDTSLIHASPRISLSPKLMRLEDFWGPLATKLKVEVLCSGGYLVKKN